MGQSRSLGMSGGACVGKVEGDGREKSYSRTRLVLQEAGGVVVGSRSRRRCGCRRPVFQREQATGGDRGGGGRVVLEVVVMDDVGRPAFEAVVGGLRVGGRRARGQQQLAATTQSGGEAARRRCGEAVAMSVRTAWKGKRRARMKAKGCRGEREMVERTSLGRGM
ncbi:hypothetical protein BGZ61DRAFT_77538 [Ilyonectria robusta]|uniref:uncharacterized protein n=1 Tax=Ilyonectria robusta TaxID=1079257 RepID=UPI001E8E58DD|nr:uncharacterized protein BGZ61DRAFT_77538 [Ilyonectria robusta]KAH8735368.1 hypothetical protein BGZ61DRAFT_77538 [Ilyonectria robusta]